MGFYGIYPLDPSGNLTYITTENHNFQWVYQLLMAIFHSHVYLPEGNHALTVGEMINKKMTGMVLHPSDPSNDKRLMTL